MGAFYIFVSRDFKDSLYVMPSQAGTAEEIRAGCWYTLSDPKVTSAGAVLWTELSLE